MLCKIREHKNYNVSLCNLHSAGPKQSFMFPLLVNRVEKSILIIVQYKYLKSCTGDFILKNLILRTRSCGTGFVTQSGWIFHFHPTIMVGWKCFVPQLYQFRRGISGGPALKYFYMIHWGGLTSSFVPSFKFLCA